MAERMEDSASTSCGMAPPPSTVILVGFTSYSLIAPPSSGITLRRTILPHGRAPLSRGKIGAWCPSTRVGEYPWVLNGPDAAFRRFQHFF